MLELFQSGEVLAAHYARVGAQPAISRARDLEDLDERLIRRHPELRAGKPIALNLAR